MKKFVYIVEGFRFEDSIAFGTAWELAKVKATELHCSIFRVVVKGKTVKYQVYYIGGLFNSTEFMRDDNVKVF